MWLLVIFKSINHLRFVAGELLGLGLDDKSRKRLSFHLLFKDDDEDSAVYSDKKLKMQRINMEQCTEDTKVLLHGLTPFIKNKTGLLDDQCAMIQDLAILLIDHSAHQQQLHLDFAEANFF